MLNLSEWEDFPDVPGSLLSGGWPAEQSTILCSGYCIWVRISYHYFEFECRGTGFCVRNTVRNTGMSDPIYYNFAIWDLRYWILWQKMPQFANFKKLLFWNLFEHIFFDPAIKNRTIYTMKISVVLFLCLIDGAAAAFAPATHPLAFKPATLSLSSISPDGFRRNKPLYKPKDTTPVPVHNVNFLQRALIGDVVLDPDYTLTWSLALLGGLIILYHPCKL